MQLTKECEFPSGANAVKPTLVLGWKNAERKPAAKTRLGIQGAEWGDEYKRYVRHIFPEAPTLSHSALRINLSLFVTLQ